MDALTPALDERAHDPSHERAVLPPESPRPMPPQALRGRPVCLDSPARSSPAALIARAVVLAATLAATLAAAYEMYMVLEVGGLTMLELVVLALFVILFAWIAFSSASMLIGFFIVLGGRTGRLGIDESGPLPDLRSRSALLLPTYNEDPQRVMARFQAIYESVELSGRGHHFDYYILSDTTDPAIWIEEEARFVALRDRTGAHRIYYRHRLENVARKAGNIADWVTRFGGSYDFMIVLDADSLMSGETIVRLAAAMERHPRAGLIQTLPVLMGGNTLFARLQQFAGRVYGPLIAQGIALWHGAEGNYWGHNAIIRVDAFAAHAGLPLLRGRKPFGGHILSHDFVEAALLRRAGWGVYLVPSLSGSYEESPPTLTDYALRDRRWCQGNLQHVGVLPARGLHWVSRLHLLTGIGSYITAPLWLLFLLAGMLISLQAQFIRPEYFPAGATLFPQWPAQDPIRAAWVFALTMALLIAPKVLGYLTMLFRHDTRHGIGGVLRGFASLMIEIVVSALIAPVMMLMQARSVLEILMGRDAGWQPQRRGDGSLARSAIVKHYTGHTIIGLLLTLGAASVSFWLLLWMLPVIAGLWLAIPVALVTSHTRLGSRLRRMGLLLTPEEAAPAAILCRAHELSGESICDRRAYPAEPLALLAKDQSLLRFHLGTLPVAKRPRRAGEINVDLLVALAKIDDIEEHHTGLDVLTAKERFALLSDRDALRRALSILNRATAKRGQVG